MQVVIDIDEDLYDHIKNSYLVCTGMRAGKSFMGVIYNAIWNGTPLPKGHGRIVDIGHYEGKVIASRKYCGINKLIEVAELDTIIEADKGE